MISSFEIKDQTIDEFTSKVKSSLTNRALGKIVNFSIDGERLIVTFSKLGTSKITYKVAQDSQLTRAVLLDEKIALAHKAFKGDLIGKVTRLLEKNGAVVTR